MNPIFKAFAAVLLFLLIILPPAFCDGAAPLSGLSIELNIMFGTEFGGSFEWLGAGIGVSFQSTNFINPCFRLNLLGLGLSSFVLPLFEIQAVFGNKTDGLAFAAGIPFLIIIPCGISFGLYYKNFFCNSDFVLNMFGSNIWNIGAFCIEPGYSIFIPAQ